MKYAQELVFVKRVRVDGATSRMLTDIQRELLRLGGLKRRWDRPVGMN